MMIITAIVVACVFVVGALALHTMYTIAELKGYERGLDEAEAIISEVRHESIAKK